MLLVTLMARVGVAQLCAFHEGDGSCTFTTCPCQHFTTHLMILTTRRKKRRQIALQASDGHDQVTRLGHVSSLRPYLHDYDDVYVGGLQHLRSPWAT